MPHRPFCWFASSSLCRQHKSNVAVLSTLVTLVELHTQLEDGAQRMVIADFPVVAPGMAKNAGLQFQLLTEYAISSLSRSRLRFGNAPRTEQKANHKAGNSETTSPTVLVEVRHLSERINCCRRSGRLWRARCYAERSDASTEAS